MMRGSRALLNAAANVHIIKSAQEYEALKLSSRVLVGYFSAKFSTPSLLQKQKFLDMANGSPNCTFFCCDIDEAPTVG